jgi:P pilus assembly chaperone PapD
MSAKACVVGVALAVVGTASATPANDPAANAANLVFAKSVGTGDINISPKRVVFGPNGRGATVYVFNRGTAPATYSIAVVDRAMMPDGRIEAIDDVNKNAAEASVAARVKSAKSLVIFTPRRVTLQPNESQTIRLRALRPSNLALGEYRTHLTVTALPPEDVGLTADAAAKPAAGQLVVRVVPVFSISIPLIVRQGAAEVRAALEAPRYALERAPNGQQKVAIVALELARLGANSVYGNIEVRRGIEVLGAVQGLAVYPEIARRAVQIPLNKIPPSGTQLSVVLVDDDTQPGVELAKAVLTVP